MYNRSWVTSKCMNYRRSQNYRTTEDLRISHPKKGTLHEIDFYLILTLGSRNGLGYSVALWYSIKKDNNNNNINNNDNNNNNINITTTSNNNINNNNNNNNNNSSSSSSSINKIL